ncbi:MAG: putative exporter of polyketide antibiotics-like protein [Actinomycetia bacterium]|nr:putative exporter of polyketide antibiotics-like protein [Actinomycetes bacterium]
MNTAILVSLWLRRDRIMLPLWVYGLTALAASTAYGFKSLYTTPGSIHSFAAGVAGNAATLAMYGPIFDQNTLGGLVAWRSVTIAGALVAVMSILLVTRHTRAEEEAGRLELIGAGVVGRRAPLTAGLLVAVIANVTVAVLATAVLAAVGLPFAGSVAFGLAWLASGLAFTAVAAVAAQLTESARTANGIAVAVLGAAYLLRAVGDAGSAHWLTWLSPIGWASQVRPYAGDRWWVLLVPAAFTALLAVAAYTLTGRRDLGAGLVPPRPGPARAAPGLRSPLALAWRLQRGTLCGWGAGFVVYGAAIGGIADGISTLVKGSSSTEKVVIEMGGGHNIVDAFLALGMGILGVLAASYVVAAALRLRGEETGQRLEPLLAARAGRIRWAAGHLVIAASGAAALLAAGGLAAGLAHGLRTHDVAGQVPRLTGGALVQAPAVWVLAGIAAALFGLLPRFTGAAWGAVGLFLLLGQLGPVLNLSQWVMDVSPFTHVPKVPGGAVSAAPLIWLAVTAAALAAMGLAAFRRRDLSL